MDGLMAGKLEESLVEKARFEAAEHIWRRTAGRTIEAILIDCSDRWQLLVVLMTSRRLNIGTSRLVLGNSFGRHA